MSAPRRSRSAWVDDAPSTRYPPLSSDLAVDAAIVGGGLTGLTTALLLKRAGLRVAVLTDGTIGGGTTGDTTAHVTTLPDEDLGRIVKTFGVAGARLMAASLWTAVDRIEALARELAPGCGFRRVDGFRYAVRERDLDALQAECEAAREIGIDAEMVAAAPLPFPTAGALRVPGQALFHPLRYLHGLAAAVHGDGSSIHENTRVTSWRDGAPCEAATPGGTVRARDLVLATHTPAGRVLSLQARLVPVMSYVLGVRLTGPAPSALFWDTDEPYHYIRPYEVGGSLALVGGNDHKTGHADDTTERLADLERWTRARFAVDAVEYRWSSELFEPADGLPYIGRLPGSPHVAVGTGYAGVGMTFGTVAALVDADLVLGRTSPWAELYSPARVKPLASAGETLRHNLDVGWRFVADRLRADPGDVADIAPGGARLVDLDGHKAAVHRDADGTLHVLSPTCPHMGCVVAWNAAESTWDCPCHGSRFDADGTAMTGPATSDLERR